MSRVITHSTSTQKKARCPCAWDAFCIWPDWLTQSPRSWDRRSALSEEDTQMCRAIHNDSFPAQTFSRDRKKGWLPACHPSLTFPARLLNAELGTLVHDQLQPKSPLPQRHPRLGVRRPGFESLPHYKFSPVSSPVLSFVS